MRFDLSVFPDSTNHSLPMSSPLKMVVERVQQEKAVPFMLFWRDYIR